MGGRLTQLLLALSLLLKLGQRLSRGVVPQWFWADTRQQLPGLSLALKAMAADADVIKQFGQVGAELIGSDLAAADAEAILLAEIDRVLALTGACSIAELTPDLLWHPDFIPVPKS